VILDLPTRPYAEGALNRGRSYLQGMPRSHRDFADGHRDALRVIADLEPLRPLTDHVSPAYRAGWDLATEEN
jgi:hypothetical protein